MYRGAHQVGSNPKYHLHGERLIRFNDAEGSAYRRLFGSALARPTDRFHIRHGYTDLAASYTLGLAKNHLFVEDDQRATFLARSIFLTSAKNSRRALPEASQQRWRWHAAALCGDDNCISMRWKSATKMTARVADLVPPRSARQWPPQII
jgi:prophage maintenance system killer protein